MPKGKHNYDARTGLAGRGEVRLVCQVDVPDDVMPLVRGFLDSVLAIFGELVDGMPHTGQRTSKPLTANMHSKDRVEEPTLVAKSGVSLKLPVLPSALNAALRAVFDAGELVRFVSKVEPGIDVASLVSRYRVLAIQRFQQLTSADETG